MSCILIFEYNESILLMYLNIMLPSFYNHIQQRPDKGLGRENQYVPDSHASEFWNSFYTDLQSKTIFNEPFSDFVQGVNPYFGNFGYSFHPSKKIPNYYNIGVYGGGDPKTKIIPVCDGVLEYSGFDIVNGYYVLISHPHIQTEDGYVMHSLYMHLKKPLVKFSSYQKMLREISFHAYPKILIERETPIGELGSTGIVGGRQSVLYVQIEFRHPYKDGVVVIDPLSLFGLKSQENIAKNCETFEDFNKLGNIKISDFKKYNIEKYIEPE